MLLPDNLWSDTLRKKKKKKKKREKKKPDKNPTGLKRREVETHGYTEKFAFVICSGNISKYDFIFILSTLKAPEIIFIYIYESKK